MPASPEQNKRIFDAIPEEGFHAPTNIAKRMDRPRIEPWRVLLWLREMAERDEIDCKKVGKRYTYARKKVLADGVKSSYNDIAKSKSLPVSTDVDAFKSTLYRLRSGKSVHLQFDDSKLRKMKGYKGHGKRLVILSPGPAVGLAAGIVVVSIVGSGCSLIRPGDSRKQTANLVLAGMPAMLASTLMNALHQVYKD